ncbi:isoleucine--tRNA ligase, partial [Candidatus Shapirobacteria bacterium CG07_land_8_20_14_0_80_39_12]
ERELDWLKNMEDWLISKKRYWGLALPIWECACGHFEVIGSDEELKEKAVEGWDKFAGHSPHRPWIDEIKIKCPKCGKIASRIKDVGNPWLDAGIIPFSTLKYQTDKKFWLEWFPADFITESLAGQFKNWFYSLIAMSTVLENTNSFKTVLGHGTVLGEDGQAMHKSMGNAIDFNEGAEKMGVDVMRWLFISHNPAENLLFGYKTADEVRRRFHLLLWNIYNFFISNALISQWQPKESKKTSQNILDRWLFSRLHNLIKQTTTSLENFDAFSATIKIEKFVNDFSTWYVRRSRDRKEDCYATFYHVLVTLAKLLAPFTPFLAEEIFKNLTDRESVHLEEWPEFETKLIDENLEKQMEEVRKICELAHAVRKETKIKVRQPLSELTITNGGIKISEDLKQLIKDELNVKKTVVKEGKGELKVSLDTQITPELKAEGEARELVRQIQDLRKKAGCRLDEKIKVAGPNWPKDKNLQNYIKKETLATELLSGHELKISK